ncbi:MAG TPA: P-II family nitrogen regulator [Spirochaetia bacterium]|nr:P-II family nitrogen regulator [Spirochaetia bacterium]
MADITMSSPLVKPKLGMMGASMNAMALIAPGAFLWITYQLQAAATAPNGASVATDIWAGIVVALVLAFLTAISYSQLAKLYPEAGFAGAVYFAEKAFLEGSGAKRGAPTSVARMAKLSTGWAAHLFYWVYPGVMVAFMATLIGYIYNQFTGKNLSILELTLIGVIFSIVTGYIAYRGITGSTFTSIVINVIQWGTLVIFSALAIYYRLHNPQGVTSGWTFSGAWDVVKPHTLTGVLVQSTIAILILVGFESSTSLSAETKNAKSTIPRAIILSLIVQGLLAYLIEYFATGTMISDKLTGVVDGKTVTGMDAAAASGAPIGDLTILIGNNVLHGIGFGLMISMAVTVAIAVIGTTLSCMNTAMRVSGGMAADQELPSMMGFIHKKFAIPHVALIALIMVSAVIGAIGVRSVVGLTGITLASNLGTFVLYGLTCTWTIVAYRKRADHNVLLHDVVPALGLLANLVMLVAIVYLYAIGNADSKNEAYIMFIIAGGWLIVSIAYVGVTSMRKSYSMKMISAMIRPESLSILMQVLKDEDLILGMTVTKIKGFGRQQGKAPGEGSGDPDLQFNSDKITLIPKVRVDLVVNDWDVPKVMEVMREALFTGKVGDGKIFVMNASDAMRIRTGEKGVLAV